MMNKPYGASPLQRQRELDAFEEQRQAYNTAMRDYEEANQQPVANFDAGGEVRKMYLEQTGREPDKEGLEYFKTRFEANIDADELAEFRKMAGQEVINNDIRKAAAAEQAAAATAADAVARQQATAAAAAKKVTDIAAGTAGMEAAAGSVAAGQLAAINQAAATTGQSPAEQQAAAVRQLTAQLAASGQSPADFYASGGKLPLTTAIANDLMLRSMTTGASTAEFDRYGGYKAVRAFYEQGGGKLNLDNVPAATLTALAQTVAKTGVGDLELLKKTGVPLSTTGYQNMIKNGIDPASAAVYLQRFGAVSPLTNLAGTNLTSTGLTGTNLTGTGSTGTGSAGVTPIDYSSILTAKPLTFNTSTRKGRTGTLGQTSAATDYTSKGVGTVGDASTVAAKGVSKPLFGQRPVRRGAAANPSNYFAYAPETLTGLAPGTVALGSVDMPLAGGKTTLKALESAPNLSPGMLGGVENAMYRTDRLGNRIYAPATKSLFGFAKGGDVDLQALLAQNNETLSDDTSEESINTDPLGSAQKMMADFSSASQANPNVSPVRKAIKQTKPAPAKSGSAKMAYESLVKGDLGAMGTAAPALKDTDSAQAQMQELARIYRLKAQASQERARGLSANTFGAPTLGQPTLTKDKLTKRRFNKGGEAKKPGVIEDIGRWLKNNDINPSDFLAALGRTGSAAGTALSPSTLNEGEDAELARRRAMPPTVDRFKGSPEGGEAKKPEAEKTESSGFFSSIFKGSDDDFIKNIKNKAEKNEDYRAMLEYLKSKDAVPDIKPENLPEGFNAVFSARRMPFVGAIGRGTIKLNKDNLAGIGPSTLAHEMAHATDRQFEKQAGDQSGIFSKGNKFTDAYEKMVGDGGMRSGKKRTELARKLYPEWVLQNKEYRALPYEMAAHGVGNFAGPTPAEKAPPHVDATAATEFQILLDLARRNSNPPVKRAGGSTEEGETSIKDQLIGAGETALTLGSGALSSVVGMPYGLYKGLTSGKYLEGKAPAIAEKEAQAFIERNTYVPRSTKGRENLEEINRLMEQSKLPPILPETAMLRSIPRAAVAAQGERIGMATEKALDKPVTEVLKKGGKSAEMLKALSAPPSNVVKKPGGNWIPGNVEEALRPLKMEGTMDSRGDAALDNWVDTSLTNYVKKQMGTPDDPVRKLAEEGITHLPQKTGPEATQYLDQLHNTNADVEVGIRRENAEFPSTGVGTSPQAKLWEYRADEAIRPREIGETISRNSPIGGLTMRDLLTSQPGGEWAAKVPDTETVNELRRPGSSSIASIVPSLGFDHIMDVLREDVTTGRIRPEQLSKVSVADAVRRTHQYDQELAAKMNAARSAAREGLPVYKEYPKGYRWIQLNRPGSFAQESDAMGHSVRGYEPPVGHPDWVKGSGNSGRLSYGHGGWEAIKSGDAKVYSLVDEKGEPHTTIEVARGKHPIGYTIKGGIDKFPETFEYNNDFEGGVLPINSEQRKLILNRAKELYSNNPSGLRMDAFQKAANEIIGELPGEVTQIKGKQNAAPNKEYLPFVQDFVKSGKWFDVQDLNNTGLVKIDANSNMATFFKRIGKSAPSYVTRDEQAKLSTWRAAGGGLDSLPEGFARGGPVLRRYNKGGSADKNMAFIKAHS